MIHIVGGGLAGSECAYYLAEHGVKVVLYEMRPQINTEAHSTAGLAELVCSNSLRSDELATGPGLLKAELADLKSLVMEAARSTRVPAGKALAVNRELFSGFITARIEAHPNITMVRKEIESLDDPALAGAEYVVIASGPLTSGSLSREIAKILGEEHLYFYDAIAPIISADSVNMEKAFWGGRYLPENTDYLNCPFTEEEYHRFCEALLTGEKTPARDFEKEIHFEGCMPIEVMAERGRMTLAFGPFKPVGFVDPRTGERPFAIMQLRAEDINKTTFNLVGFQTKLTYPEQRRIFRMVPGLEEAEFVRFGSMHRNTYVNAPAALGDDLALKQRPGVFMAGQITGVEGYLESAACGLWLGMLLAARKKGVLLEFPPVETALGGLLNHLKKQDGGFQPSNIHFGLLPELGRKMRKAERKAAYAERAQESFAAWLSRLPAGWK